MENNLASEVQRTKLQSGIVTGMFADGINVIIYGETRKKDYTDDEEEERVPRINAFEGFDSVA